MSMSAKNVCSGIGCGLLAGAAFVLIAFLIEETIIRDLSGKL